MSESRNSEGAIFDIALQLPAGQRASYVEHACAGDLVLRHRVEALLLALESAGTFMTTPAVAPISLCVLGTPGDAQNPHLVSGHPLTEEPADEAVGQTLGRYRLLEKIGEGGCGVVYVAEQNVPVRRHVAIKVIKLGMDTRQVIARFEAERQALAMMDHPNIAKVLDGGATETGRPYFAMELVRGVSITRYCDDANLSIRKRLDLFILVCHAIQHAHQKGIIHRDIKPSNILVTLHDGVPVPKVIDFGIAKAMEGRLTDGTVYTQLHPFIGTPGYMSPEQAEMTGLDMDTRSDIYSLGVLLYELLAGRTPFDAKELMASGLDAMRKIIREQEPMRPSTCLRCLPEADSTLAARHRSTDTPKLTHQVRGDLDWIVLKCLEKDRTRRYETANGLAFDLKRHLNDELVLARPASIAYRFGKAFRRHRLIFSVVTVVAVTLVAGIGVTTRQTFVARKAQRDTEAARQSELKANESLRIQVGETEKAKRNAETAARLEGEQRLRVEGTLELMRVQKAEDLLRARESVLGIGYLLRVLRANPSNEVAATRLASVMIRSFVRELTKPLRHDAAVSFAQFSPDGLRIATASDQNSGRVWDAQTGEPLTMPLRHGGTVWSVQFSPDGSRVVTASEDATARMWDARTGLALGEPLRHAGAVRSASFSPDGSWIVTASTDHTARVWRAQTGQAETGPLQHAGVVYAAQFSPDGLRVATASADQTARVWDARTGQAMHPPLRHQGVVHSTEFSPDSRRVVTASWDGSARVWDSTTGHPLTPAMAHKEAVQSAQFSPDGLRVVTASNDRTARIWNADTGQLLFEMVGHTDSLLGARFSPDGLQVVTVSGDSTAQFWNAHTGQPTTEPLWHDREVGSAQFSPDGSRLVTTCWDYTARIWQTRQSGGAAEPRPRALDPLRHEAGVLDAQFSPDGSQVITASEDHTARIWSVRTGRLATGPLRHEGPVFRAQFSPDGLRVVTASGDNTARVWDAQTSQPLTQPLQHADLVRSAEFSPDGLRILTASEDNTARVWDARTGEPLTQPIWELALRYAEFSPDGLRVVTAATGSQACAWDLLTGQPVSKPLKHHGLVVSSHFSSDGRRLVTASHDFTAGIWDAQSGHPVTPPLLHRKQVNSARFSPDGLWVVTGSMDNTARVWDARTGDALTEPLRHGGGVWSAQFSQDASRIVTASDDQTARIWDRATGQPLSDSLRHNGPLRSARFSPDGRWVVTASFDGTARLWDVERPSLPVPAWFLEWTEARVGRRLAKAGGSEAIPVTEQRRLRAQAQSRTDASFYTRLAQWIEADPANPAVPPSAWLPPDIDRAPISPP